MNRTATIEVEQSHFKAQLTAWRRALGAEHLTITRRARDPLLKRRARDLELSIAVLDFGLYKLEGTGMTLGDLPIGALLREAGHNVTSESLPQRGSLLDW